MSHMRMLRSGDGTLNFDGDYVIPKKWVPGTYRVVECLIPNTAYPITTGSNDTLTWLDGTTSRTCKIPQGYYTWSDLPGAIATAMNAVSNGANVFTVTIPNGNTIGKLLFSATGPFTLTFAKDPNNVAPATTLGKILGFDNINYVAAGTGPYTVTAPYSLNLAWNMAFYVTISGSITEVKYGYNDPEFGCSFVVPVTVSENSMTVYRLPHHTIVKVSESTRDFTLKIVDDSNKRVNFQGSNFYFLLEPSSLRN